jgi:hypothetical protein
MTKKQTMAVAAAVLGIIALVLIVWNVRNLFGPPPDPAAGVERNEENLPPAPSGRLGPGVSPDDE